MEVCRYLIEKGAKIDQVSRVNQQVPDEAVGDSTHGDPSTFSFVVVAAPVALLLMTARQERSDSLALGGYQWAQGGGRTTARKR